MEAPGSGTSTFGWVNRRAAGPMLGAWLVAFTCRAPLVAPGPLMPLIRRALLLSGSTSSLLTALPLLLMAALSIPGGWLGDRFGPRRVLIAGEVVLLLGALGRSLYPSVAMLLVGTAVMGGGIGLVQPALAQVAATISRRHAGFTTAVYTSGLMVGSLAATFLSATWLLTWLPGWRAVLLVWTVPGALGLLVWVALGNPAPTARPESLTRRTATFRWRAYPGLTALIAAFGAQSVVFYGLVTWLTSYYVHAGWTVQAASIPSGFLAFGSLAGALASPVLLRAAGGIRRPMLWAGFATLAGVLGLLGWPALGDAWAFLAGAATALAFTLGLAAAPLLAGGSDTGRLAGTIMAAGYGVSVLGPVAVGGLLEWTGTFTAGMGLLAGFALAIAAAAWILPGTSGPSRGEAQAAP